MTSSYMQTINDARQFSTKQYFNQIFKFRHLLIALAVRDLKLKFIQSKIGLIWTLIQPITALIIYSYSFTHFFQFSNKDYPYSLYVFSGVIPWTLFSYMLGQGSQVLISNQDLIRKLSFPKIILLGAKSLVAFIEIVPAILIMIGLMIYYQIPLSLHSLFFPFLIILSLITAIVAPLWLSALSVKHRDVLHAVPYLTNFGIWITPVFWMTENSPEFIKYLLVWNPLSFLMSLFRWTLFSTGINWGYLPAFLTWILVVSFFGFLYFKKQEKNFIDIL